MKKLRKNIQGISEDSPINEQFTSSMIPAPNWWACYRADAKQSLATADSRCMGKDAYKGDYFYCRLICFTCDAFWIPGENDPIHMIDGHSGGVDIHKTNSGSYDQFVAYIYSEEDISKKTTLPE